MEAKPAARFLRRWSYAVKRTGDRRRNTARKAIDAYNRFYGVSLGKSENPAILNAKIIFLENLSAITLCYAVGYKNFTFSSILCFHN